MASCKEPIIVENIDFCPIDETASGTSEVEIYGAYIQDFKSIAAPPKLADANTFAEAATIKGSHEFKEGRGFFKISILPDTGMIESAIAGEKGSKSFTNSFSGTIPGTSARNIGFARYSKNAPMIFVIAQTDGLYKQIGSQVKPAYLEDYTATSGAKAEDVHGITFKISDVQAYLAPLYLGTLTEFTPIDVVP